MKWNQEIVKSERGEFEVFIKGMGKPLCVTHLYSECNDTGDYFAESLTEFYKVHLVNLKGSGNSSPIQKQSDLSIIDSVKDIDSVRRALGIDSWTYAGHSTGGMLGLVYAKEFEETIDSLILVGTAASKEYKENSYCIFNKNHHNFQRLQDIFKMLTSNTLSLHERKSLSDERIKFSLFKPQNYDEYFSKQITKGLSAKRLEYFSFVELPNFDVKEGLEYLRIKTLVICGKHDVQCPVRCSRVLHELIPQSTLHILKESNHYPFIEEELNYREIIRDFSNNFKKAFDKNRKMLG